ncbi:MAG: DUF211 domain-containing protein [Candidatus Aenigmarchaeota archaeon]|nr:DUF211 domain-containing protein [Candidatus Aenigmarchaeota archaeon]
MGKRVNIRRIVLDVLKPLEPSLIVYAKHLASIKGVDGVNLVVYEVDRNTETVKITIEGKNLVFEEIKKVIDMLNGAIHSIDEVVAGKKIVGEKRLPTDGSRE